MNLLHRKSGVADLTCCFGRCVAVGELTCHTYSWFWCQRSDVTGTRLGTLRVSVKFCAVKRK